MVRQILISTLLICVTANGLLAHGEGDERIPHARVASFSKGTIAAGAFYENRGQIVNTEKQQLPDIKYYAFYTGTRMYFTPQGWHTVFSVLEDEENFVSEATGRIMDKHDDQSITTPWHRTRERTSRLYRMDMSFVGSNADVEIEATMPLQQHLNYYMPHCVDGVTAVPGFGTLRYRNLYDNIDLVLHASKDGLKYEFEVRPGGQVENIKLRHDGHEGIEQMEDGSLRILWPRGFTHESPPFSYQEGKDGLSAIQSAYQVDGNIVGFSIDSYDSENTLTIDPWSTHVRIRNTEKLMDSDLDTGAPAIGVNNTPVREFDPWSTYYGGSDIDYITSVTCDSVHAVIGVGNTSSYDFPTHQAWQTSKISLFHTIFIVKFDSTGRLRWATYFGGSKHSGAEAVGTDPDRNIIVVGDTYCDDFPVHNALQSQLLGTTDAIIAKFDTNGMRLWATYFGGEDKEAAYDVAIDDSGDIFVTGTTTSPSAFPLLLASQSAYGGGNADAFFMKMNGDGDLLFSSYFGGNEEDMGRGISVNTKGPGNFVISGSTRGGSFPLQYARQPTYGGGLFDAYVAMFDRNGALLWSTYHGGNDIDHGLAVTFDFNGNVLITGATRSDSLPVMRAWQAAPSTGMPDGYVSKLSSQGTLIWSTYYGGSNSDTYVSIVADNSSSVYVGGITYSRIFPVYQAAYPQMRDPIMVAPKEGCIVKFDSAGIRKWATYLGGNSYDQVNALALDTRGFLYAAGETRSDDFPIYRAWQDTIAGQRVGGNYRDDAFIHRFDFDGRIPVTLSHLSAQRVLAGVELLWRAESEVNVYGYMIERRYEQGGGAANDRWHDIGFVAAAARRGEAREYSFLDGDLNPTDTRIRYRLRMIDLDGTYEHSPVVEVGPAQAATTVSFETVYPAPARDWLTLNFALPVELPVTLSVYDVSGREITRIHDGRALTAGMHSIVLPVGEWRSGLYLCTLVAGETKIVRKAMVVR